MTAEHDLASTITGTWPLGPTTAIWTNTLAAKFQDLDLAWRAYRHLRDTHHGRDMTIPAFADAYRAERNRQRRDSHHHEPAQPCPKGAGCDGWTTIHREHNGHTITAAQPCTCIHGRRNEPLAASIIEHNTTQLDRILGAGRHEKPAPRQPTEAAS